MLNGSPEQMPAVPQRFENTRVGGAAMDHVEGSVGLGVLRRAFGHTGRNQ
jgi:hypothetical protein